MKKRVLIDTSIWIGYLRKKPDYFPTVETLLDRMQGYVTEPIISELLQGVKTINEFEKLKTYIDALPLEICRLDDWINASGICFDLRKKCLTIPLIDALIASVAIRSDMEVFTLDKHFELIPGVTLYIPQ